MYIFYLWAQNLGPFLRNPHLFCCFTSSFCLALCEGCPLSPAIYWVYYTQKSSEDLTTGTFWLWRRMCTVLFNPPMLADRFGTMISVCCCAVAVLYHSWVIGEGIGDASSDKQWVSSNWIRQSLLWSKYFLSFLSLFLPQPVFLQKVLVYFLWQLWAKLFCKSLQLGYGYVFDTFLKKALCFWSSVLFHILNVLKWTEKII